MLARNFASFIKNVNFIVLILFSLIVPFFRLVGNNSVTDQLLGKGGTRKSRGSEKHL